MARFKIIDGEPYYFDFIPIDQRQQLLHQSFGLRYEVYCEHRNFLAATDYPDGIETDEFDQHSYHIGAVNGDCEVIGTVRMVRPSEEQGLPLEGHCQFFEDFPASIGAASAKEALHRPGNVEISRLVVSANYLRRANDGYYAMSDSLPTQLTPNEKRNLNRPAIALGMYRELYRFSKRNGITHWLAAMEKVLRHYLKRQHIVFEAIGPEIDYYGPVTPYMLDVDDIGRRMKQKAPVLYEFWNHDLDREPQPEFQCPLAG